MNIDIDLHILKKLVYLQKEKEKTVNRIARDFAKARKLDSELTALLEFIEGECNAS